MLRSIKAMNEKQLKTSVTTFANFVKNDFLDHFGKFIKLCSWLAVIGIAWTS